MPVREKRPRSAGSCPARPFSRPSHTQTAAKLRGFSQTAQGLAAETDSPLEGGGFELSDPRGDGFRTQTPLRWAVGLLPSVATPGHTAGLTTMSRRTASTARRRAMACS